MLCYDTIFKAVFTGQENILAKMVSDITGIDYEILKDNMILETTELPISKKNEKAKRCDFILKIGNDNIINLELNAHRYAGVLVKNLSYLFNLFTSSSKKGEKYNENLIVTQINLNCYKEVKYGNVQPLSIYHLREDKTNELYIKNIAIYDLNVVKCSFVYYNEDNKKDLPNYIKWGALIYSRTCEEILEVAKDVLSFKERKTIMGILDKLTHEDLFYSEEEALEWAEWERNSIRDEAQKEGRQEGIKEGIKEGKNESIKEMILSMNKNNISIEVISKITQKSIDEINEILNKN